MSIVDRIRDSLPASLWRQGIVGCTEEDLAHLAQTQSVSCLPEVYREVMLFMGRRGIGWVLDANATVQQLQDGTAKKLMCHELDREHLSYPSDIFVFSEHQGYAFHFFRTRDCEIDTDPPVFYFESQYFYKVSDTVTELILQELTRTRFTAVEWDEIERHGYYYDSERDELVLATSSEKDVEN